MSKNDQPLHESEIEERYLAIKDRVWRATERCGREPASVRLVAVTKTFGKEHILPVLRQGHMVFGENRVQEAMKKWPALRQRFPAVELHLIGPLQTNKTKEAVALFDVIQTLDRVRLADSLAAGRDRQGKCPRVLVQVNTGEEPQKAGILPADAEALIAYARKLELPLIGLMCIPPVEDDVAPHFAFLAKLARENGLAELSMGMSGDFEMAVRFGATYVRVGSAIFGERVKATS